MPYLALKSLKKRVAACLVVVLMGTLTGAGGGVLRDLMSAKIPLILRQDIYASAAIAGILVYALLRKANVPTAGRLQQAF